VDNEPTYIGTHVQAVTAWILERGRSALKLIQFVTTNRDKFKFSQNHSRPRRIYLDQLISHYIGNGGVDLGRLYGSTTM